MGRLKMKKQLVIIALLLNLGLLGVFGRPLSNEEIIRDALNIFGLPVDESKKIFRRNDLKTLPTSVDTPFGTFPVSNRNTMTIDKRNQFLPVMMALLKVMESSRPTSRDVNKLLMYSRDLLKKIRGDKSNLSFIQFISNFYNFNNGKLNVIIEFFDLLMDGDVIVDVDGTPYVLTQIGNILLLNNHFQPVIFFRHCRWCFCAYGTVNRLLYNKQHSVMFFPLNGRQSL